MSRSKDKGTAAESMLVEYLQNHGWPYAERRALAGVADKGDVSGTPGIVWECKHAGREIRMAEWVQETVAERANAKAEHGVLVIKPRGYGQARVGEWFAVMVEWDLNRLCLSLPPGSTVLGGTFPYVQSKLRTLVTDCLAQRDGTFSAVTLRPPGLRERTQEWYVVTTLSEMTDLLRTAGFGTPLP